MKVLLAACDTFRPAAIDQLKTLGSQVGVDVFSIPDEKDPVKVAQAAVSKARSEGYSAVIVDTAGRLVVDQELMDEIKRIHDAIKPGESLFVVDAMTGQDAVESAKAFNQAIDYDGVVLSKMDGDTRGGAALSIKAVTGKSIKFVSNGEKMDALDIFYPSRIADRILGMGDVVSLVEKAQEQYDEQQTRALKKKLVQNKFTLQDFYDSRVTGGFASYYESYGASIVCTAEYNNMNYIAVILGATRTFAENGWQPVNYGNFNEMASLLEYAFNSFKINRIIYEDMALSTFKVNGGECNAVGQATVNVDSVVPINAQMKNIQMNYKAVGGGLSAPIKKDQLIATLEVVYRTSVLAEVEVYAMSDVKPADKTGVTIRSAAVEGSKAHSGFLSALGTICVIVLGAAIAYMTFNAYMRTRIRARRKKRRSQRRRSN